MIDDETFTCAPDGGSLKRKLLGYAVPVLIALYAIIYGLIDGHIILPSKHASDEFTGFAARWLGLAYLAVASFMHFHYGWGLSEHLWPNSQRGKWISVAAFVPCFILALVYHFKSA
jgi:hypothetical protein